LYVLTVLRESVDPGEHVDVPLEKRLAVDDGDVLQDVVTRIVDNDFLAGGGDAAWVLASSKRRLAVFCRQWKAPCFLVPQESPILAWIVPGDRWQLYFSYLQGTDPEVVYRRLKQP